MKRYVTHAEDGSILRTGWCQDHVVAAQAAPGETAIEGIADAALDVVFAGRIMRRTHVDKLRAEAAAAAALKRDP